jgi:hypothetical protein
MQTFGDHIRNNISLIGMPGAGKSTAGIILAKNCGLGFIDTDVLIQINPHFSQGFYCGGVTECVCGVMLPRTPRRT